VPIYEYKCSECGKVFEALQKFTDAPLERCKFCEGPVERLISNTSFQLKGSGWYLTDYARKSSATKSSGSESDGGAKSDAGKADTGTTKSPTESTAKPKDSGGGTGGSKSTSDS
jgi:putative FmdB family regulatory protein